jgi:hypothetical protein
MSFDSAAMRLGSGQTDLPRFEWGVLFVLGVAIRSADCEVETLRH